MDRNAADSHTQRTTYEYPYHDVQRPIIQHEFQSPSEMYHHNTYNEMVDNFNPSEHLGLFSLPNPSSHDAVSSQSEKSALGLRLSDSAAFQIADKLTTRLDCEANLSHGHYPPEWDEAVRELFSDEPEDNLEYTNESSSIGSFFDLSSTSSNVSTPEEATRLNDLTKATARSWRNDLLREEVWHIYKRVTKSWPKEFTGEQLSAHLTRFCDWLESHRELIPLLLKDDKSAWEKVFTRWSPAEMNKVRGPRRRHSLNWSIPVWCTKGIHSRQRKYLLTRLSAHWNGLSESNVRSRLTNYAALYGKVTSPEVLWEDDNDRFLRAADAIFREDAPHGERHVGASDHDILHRNKDESPNITDDDTTGSTVKKRVQIRPSSARFNTGHAWLNLVNPTQVNKIHQSVRSHWREKICAKVITKLLIAINDYLEHHNNLIWKILSGDQQAAYTVAEAVVNKKQYMKSVH